MSDDRQANKKEAVTPATAHSNDAAATQDGFAWWILVIPIVMLGAGLFGGALGPLITFAALLLLGIACVILAVLERDREDTAGKRMVRLYLAASLSLGLAAGAGVFLLALA